MIRLTRRAVHELRRLRGRCPSCNSIGPAVQQCRTCHGYQGPFPVAEDMQARWLARSERTLDAATAVRPAPAAQAIPAHS